MKECEDSNIKIKNHWKGLKRNSCMRRNVKLPREEKENTLLAGHQPEDKKSKLYRISQRSRRVSTQPLKIPDFFDRKVT